MRVEICKMCGKCCEGGIKVYQPIESTHTFEFLKRKKKGCALYDRVKKQCKVHGDKKPEMCILFPYFPENRPKGCGFKFRRVL